MNKSSYFFILQCPLFFHLIYSILDLLVGLEDFGFSASCLGWEIAPLPQSAGRPVRAALSEFTDLFLHALDALNANIRAESINIFRTFHPLSQHIFKIYLMLIWYKQLFFDLTSTQACMAVVTCEIARNAPVFPSFSPPLDIDSADCLAVLAASSTPSLIFFPMSERPTSSKPWGETHTISTDHHHVNRCLNINMSICKSLQFK